jgi:thermitase
LKRRNVPAAVTIVVLFGLVVAGMWPVTAKETQHLGADQDPTALPASVAGPSSNDEFKEGEILVKFRKGVSKLAVEDAPMRHGAAYELTLYGSDVELWRVPEGSELAIIDDLNSDPTVEHAQPNYRYYALGTPNDPSFGNQWAHARINSTAAWDITTGSPDVTIAILDTGIDEGHPDLSAKIVAGKDYVDDDLNPHDENGHGTHVAGIAAAVTNNGVGIAGMNWQANIMPIRVLDRTGIGWTDDIAQGINWAYGQGARVLNLSLGSRSDDPIVEGAVDDAYEAGALVVAAMGNCRTYDPPYCPSANPTMYPAAYNQVMAVAATNLSDSYASFSQYGPHCDIAAPGGHSGIYSTMPQDAVYLTTDLGYSNYYDYLQGTSQATPHVAGLAALVWSAAPALTPTQVQNVIQQTALDLGDPGQDEDYGHGLIDAEAALQAVTPPPAPTLSPIDNADGDGDYLVNWTDVANATSYTLEEDDDDAFPTPTVRYGGSASQFAVSGQGGGTWYYRARGANLGGNGPPSNIRSVTVKPAAPILSPINNPDGDGSYRVQWSASSGAEGYRLEEDDNPGFGSPTEYDTGLATAFDVTGQEGGTWYYRVRAYNLAGDSPRSSRQSVTVKPGAPILDFITNPGNDDEYQVSWSAATGATGYTLEQDTSPSFSGANVRYDGMELQYNVTGQDEGNWHYRVRAYNSAGHSLWSTDDVSTTVILDPQAPDAPELLSIDNADADAEYLVDWLDVTGAISYTLEESPNPYFDHPTEIYSGTTEGFTVTHQLSGLWHYRVRAVGTSANSPWSNEESVLVPYWLNLPIVFRAYSPPEGVGLPITEGFESGDVPPSGWTNVPTNPRETWGVYTNPPYDPPPEGTHAAICLPDEQQASQSEVLLTPEFQATQAQLQFYSFGNVDRCTIYEDNCDLNIWLVVGSWDGGVGSVVDDIFVWPAEQDWDGNGVWSLSTVSLTPYLPMGTPLRVGFEYYGQDGEAIGLDAVSIHH